PGPAAADRRGHHPLGRRLRAGPAGRLPAPHRDQPGRGEPRLLRRGAGRVLATVTRDSLARNSILIMASTVGTSGLGYLFWMLAARGLPPPAIGTATALISAGTVV